MITIVMDKKSLDIKAIIFPCSQAYVLCACINLLYTGIVL